MKEISKESICAAADKSLHHLIVGPFRIIDNNLDRALAHANATRSEMLKRWAESKPTSGMAAEHASAANDALSDHELYLNQLAYSCVQMEALKVEARLYAIQLVELEKQRELMGKVTPIAQAVGLMSEKVSSPLVFRGHKIAQEARKDFAKALQGIVETDLPKHALQMGIDNFEQTVRDEFREKSI